MARALGVAAAALMLASACGAFPRGGASLPAPSPPTAALAKWQNFPVNASPRPLIVFEPTVERIGPNGFVSEPDRKVDWGCNKFAFARGVEPSTAMPGALTLGAASYPGISSARAWAELMNARKPAEVPPGCSTSRPFVIKAIRLGSAGIFTDRGVMRTPAWLFDVEEIEAYLAYVAIDPAAFWNGRLTAEGRGAGVTKDGLTLKIGVSNAERGPCGSDYTTAVVESNTAVVVAVRQIPHASPSEPVACDLMMRISFIDVMLKAPLGNRVLVDEDGHAGAACLDADACVVGPDDVLRPGAAKVG